jgi:TolB-like protein/tetratricopeptide (TPR) repeat protein
VHGGSDKTSGNLSGVILPVTEPSHAVFLSYASQDAGPARQICDSLRAAGIEVWFDQSELRGGDAWDRSIRRQIKTCALFIPVISHATHDRREGYFRLEWKLAVDRSHLMDAEMAFLLPVVIDDTRDDDERVPERFREVQWTRLPGGVTPPAFVQRIRGLLSGEPPQRQTGTILAAPREPAAPSTRKGFPASWRSKPGLLAAIAVLVVLALGYLAANRLVLSKRGAELGAAPAPAAQSGPAAAFNPPPHSIAVLPFVNLSGDKEQEYFSDGLTEELLNSLAEINELQVAARTSSFHFKGKDVDLGTVAHDLNVGAVLEGSVRRSANTVRITAQLINAVTGFHLWSKTYDRDLGDVLKLQTEIASAVAGALKVTLLGDVGERIELGGTRDPAAFDAYLRGANAWNMTKDPQSSVVTIGAYDEAIRLDPHYARAFAGRAIATCVLAPQYERIPAIQPALDRGLLDAQHALALAPALAKARLALATCFERKLDFLHASQEYERAAMLAPSDAEVLQAYGRFSAWLGHADAGIAMARRAVALDPLNPLSHQMLGETLIAARRYDEALAAFRQFESLDTTHDLLGLVQYLLGKLESARSACEFKPTYWGNQVCLAIVYEKLGRHADAQALLGKMKADYGDVAAYQYAEIYAQWGNASAALDWLEASSRLHDDGLIGLKIDPLLDPLRKEPRFQAIERELKFPS